MRSITLISLLILLSLSYADEIGLPKVLTDLLPEINKRLTQTLTFSKSYKFAEASASITFKEITKENVLLELLRSSVLLNLKFHLKITNLKADANAKFLGKKFIRFFRPSVKGEIKTNIDIKFEVLINTLNDKITREVNITYFKTDIDLSLIFGKIKIKIFNKHNKLTKPFKRAIEERIDKFAQSKLQNLIDSKIDYILKNCNDCKIYLN